MTLGKERTSRNHRKRKQGSKEEREADGSAQQAAKENSRAKRGCANDVTVRVRPPPGEFAVGVSRRARGTFTRPRHGETRDARRHGATLSAVSSAAIAGDGSTSGDGSGDRAIVAVLMVYARPYEWFIPPRHPSSSSSSSSSCRASRWGTVVAVRRPTVGESCAPSDASSARDSLAHRGNLPLPRRWQHRTTPERPPRALHTRQRPPHDQRVHPVQRRALGRHTDPLHDTPVFPNFASAATDF
ncbi:hypothetical protein G5I_13613 [Acromyrmex echinatior]|uniref:Uncharacterized protein n=1 Tax=Acromyrmex echinatior TaxID=103372 RepID=F4X5I0_ACREC|nr:hypothetical protein G5I_13613 [Acromyrmex echinatior]